MKQRLILILRYAFTLFLILMLKGSKNQQETELVTDQYGGILIYKGNVTGWFHLQNIEGRDVLITPEGHPFIMHGVRHIGDIWRQMPNNSLLMNKYKGNRDKLNNDIREQLEYIGINALDIKAPEEFKKNYPYIPEITLFKTAKFFSGPDGKNPYEFPDIFDPARQKELDEKIMNYCLKYRDDRFLIGYHWTDTPTWDLAHTRTFRKDDWVSAIRRLPSDAPGKLRYIEFLRVRYNNDIDAFSRAYGIAANSFEDLSNNTFSDLDFSRYDVVKDDRVFLGIIAKRSYEKSVIYWK